MGKSLVSSLPPHPTRLVLNRNGDDGKLGACIVNYPRTAYGRAGSHVGTKNVGLPWPSAGLPHIDRHRGTFVYRPEKGFPGKSD